MRKLELKHLAPYLPYGLIITDGEYNRKLSIHSTTYSTNDVGLSRLFAFGGYDYALGLPALHQLSDLTKEIEHNGERFVPSYRICKQLLYDDSYVNTDDNVISIQTHANVQNILIAINNEILDECPCGIYRNLLEWHFDLFGLIEDGLAIDIKTISHK